MRFFILGLLFGIVCHGLYINLKYTTFGVPAFAVGDCLSNGLYYEKIVEIRNPKFSSALYVTHSYIQGKLSAPDTVETWIADKNYVKINPLNCTVRDGN